MFKAARVQEHLGVGVWEHIYPASSIWKSTGISLVEVFERVEKAVILIRKKAQKGEKVTLWS